MEAQQQKQVSIEAVENRIFRLLSDAQEEMKYLGGQVRSLLVAGAKKDKEIAELKKKYEVKTEEKTDAAADATPNGGGDS